MNAAHKISLPVFFALLLVAVTALATVNYNRAIPPPIESRATASKPSPTPASLPVDKAKTSQVKSAYGKLPLTFELNQGQTDAQVKFLSRGSGYNLFLTPNAAALELRQSERATGRKSVKNATALSAIRNLKSALVRLQLLNANPQPEVSGMDELPGKSNYFLGNDPQQWRTNVPNFAKVKYANVYPGVDQIYYGNQQQLEYDFVVAPHADPSVIKLSFDGATSLRLNKQGDLILQTATGQIVQKKPELYQTINGIKLDIAGYYNLQGKNQVGFVVGAYNKSQPLVIDPRIVYTTFLGGSGNDYPNDIANDAEGNAYVTGYTFSADFPTTANSVQPTASPASTIAFVTKLNSDGSAFVYSTYLGGTLKNSCAPASTAVAIAVDANNNAYIGGTTNSQDFPTLPASNLGSCTFNGFVTQLNATGGLQYSAYVPNVLVKSLGVDTEGKIQVLGEAFISPLYGQLLQTTPTAYNQQGGLALVKIDPTQALPANPSNNLMRGMAQPIYATYTGAFLNNARLVIDAAGNTIIAGDTTATNVPTTPNAVQPALAGKSDTVVLKFDWRQTGSAALLYATYLGGSEDDTFSGLTVNSNGEIYLTGTMNSVNFPLTAPYKALENIRYKYAYQVKLDSTKAGTAGLLYSGYYGFGGFDKYGVDVGVDEQGQAYYLMSDQSGSQVLPMADDATRGTAHDLPYPSYGNAIAVAPAGLFYVTGQAWPGFPAGDNAAQSTLKGGVDGFVFKYDEYYVAPPPDPPTCDPGSGLAQTNTSRKQGAAAGGGGPAVPCITPLIFIPGTAASRLDSVDEWQDDIPVKTTNIFPGGLRTSAQGLFRNKMSLKPGEVDPTVFAPDVLRVDSFSYFKPYYTYDSLLKYLTDKFTGGYVEYPVANLPGRRTEFGCRLPLPGEPSPTLFVFAYDWRQDNNLNVAYLEEYLSCIRKIYPGLKKVNILAHSMGGLLARKFILNNPGKIDKLITIGTPWVGAPKAVNVMETGAFMEDWVDDFPFVKSTFKKLVEYFPSQYQILPSQYYFYLGGKPFAEDGWDINNNGISKEVYSYEQFASLMDNLHPQVLPGTAGKAFHSPEQDDWREDQSGVTYYHIWGQQSERKTVGQVIAKTVTQLYPDLTFADVSVFTTSFTYGDGTVPSLSAHRTTPNWGLNAPTLYQGKTWIYRSLDKAYDDSVQHTQITSNPDVQNNIYEMLRGHSLTGMSNSQPQNNKSGKKTKVETRACH